MERGNHDLISVITLNIFIHCNLKVSEKVSQESYRWPVISYSDN